MKHLTAIGLCLALGACAGPPQTYRQVNVNPSGPVDLETARTICDGEMQKSYVSQAEAKIYLPWEKNPMQAIFAGCMARYGYARAG